MILMVLVFPALALGETMDDLVHRDGLFYKKFTDVPFTGKITGGAQGAFRNGKKEGSWVGHRENGQLLYEGTYKTEKKEGFWVWYHDDGQLWKKGTYKDGVKIN